MSFYSPPYYRLHGISRAFQNASPPPRGALPDASSSFIDSSHASGNHGRPGDAHHFRVVPETCHVRETWLAAANTPRA